jgi:hypothetical protein
VRPCEKRGFRLEHCKLFSPNPEKARTRLTIFSTWLGDAVVARSLSAGSRFPGFTSHSAMNCRKNFFVGAKGSVLGRRMIQDLPEQPRGEHGTRDQKTCGSATCHLGLYVRASGSLASLET